jgi:hypothetical protein
MNHLPLSAMEHICRHAPPHLENLCLSLVFIMIFFANGFSPLLVLGDHHSSMNNWRWLSLLCAISLVGAIYSLHWYRRHIHGIVDGATDIITTKTSVVV